MKIITVKILPTGWEDTGQLIRFENNVNRYWFLEYSDTQKEWQMPESVDLHSSGLRRSSRLAALHSSETITAHSTSSKTILALYRGRDVEIKEKTR